MQFWNAASPTTAPPLCWAPKLQVCCRFQRRNFRISHWRCGNCLGALLKHLKSRFGTSAEFPHEIGLFLDYPAADVEAFMTGAAECKLRGYWKVYCDVEAARERFACYDACRQCMLRMLAAGSTISQLLRAA